MTSLSGKMRLAGVIGWPIGHSLSPRLHNHWLQEHRIDGVYVALPVAPDSLATAVRGLLASGFRGFNVTVPHKEAVVSLLDRLAPEAQRVGAVNTVVLTADGAVEGRNTDGYGFLENLRQGVPEYHPADGPAAVVGAGGAARAVVAALLDAGAPQVRLVNRSTERAEQLAAAVGGAIQVLPWEDRADALHACALLVNTTTLGMTGQPALDLSLAHLPPGAAVTDLVYHPLCTPLLSAAARAGYRTVDGLGMLLHQARPGFHAWFGVEPAVTARLHDYVAAGLAKE